MMVCSEQSRLGAYHDGELSAADREAVAAHLATCAACTAELAVLVRQSQQFRSMSLPRLSQLAAARLHASIDRSIGLANERAAELGMLRIARTLASIAACVLVAGTVWLSVGPERVSPKAAPPWTGVALNSETESVSQDITTPAAQWYLADASKGNDDR